MQMPVAKRSNVMPVNPADFIIELTMSGPDIENGPGPPMDFGRIFVCRHRHHLPDMKFGIVQPGIVLALAPHHLRKHAAGFQRHADVSHRGARQHEKHRSEARKCVIVGAAQVVDLHVRREKCDVTDSSRRCFLFAGPDEILGAIDTHSLARRADFTGDLQGAVAESAADIEDTIAGMERAPREHLVTVPGETRDQQVLEAHEFVEQDRVPGLDDDVIVDHGSALRAMTKA